MEKSQTIKLESLDPKLFCKSSFDGAELEDHFLCLVCLGVVLDPIECIKCETLYCKECIPRADMACYLQRNAERRVMASQIDS